MTKVKIRNVARYFAGLGALVFCLGGVTMLTGCETEDDDPIEETADEFEETADEIEDDLD